MHDALLRTDIVHAEIRYYTTYFFVALPYSTMDDLILRLSYCIFFKDAIIISYDD